VEPSVISTLKEKAQNKLQYVSEEEQDRIDGEMLRKRSKADRKLVDWETVKRRYVNGPPKSNVGQNASLKAFQVPIW
jgi:hypothetical protein